MKKPIYKPLYKKLIAEGIDPALLGFMYIHEAVLGMELNETMGSVCKRVAEEMGVTPGSVERNIRHAIPKGVRTSTFLKKIRMELSLEESGEEKVERVNSDQLELKFESKEESTKVTPLTRAEIRRLEREAKSDAATVQLSYGQLKAYKNELAQEVEKFKKTIVEDVSNQTFLLMLGIPVLAMKDLFEVNVDMLDKFTDKILTHYQSFCEGRVTIEEIWKIIEEETGKTLSYYKDKT